MTNKRAFAAGTTGSLIFDPKINYYKILGVKDSANEAEIKNAFYGLAKKYHPDGHTND